MNKIFCLSICVITSLAGMEPQYVQDYRTLMAIKNQVFELAAQVKRDHKLSSIVLQPSRAGIYNCEQQTEQGFVLIWEVDKPRALLWRLGSLPIVESTSSIHRGQEFLLKSIVEKFQASEVVRVPRLLRTSNGQEIPIEGQEIVVYALNRLGGRPLPAVIFKEQADLVNEETAKKIYKQLETQ